MCLLRRLKPRIRAAIDRNHPASKGDSTAEPENGERISVGIERGIHQGLYAGSDSQILCELYLVKEFDALLLAQRSIGGVLP